MSESGTLLHIYLHESDRTKAFGNPVFEDIVKYLFENGDPGVTVLRGEAGLDKKGHVLDAHTEYISYELPIEMQIYGPTDQISRIVASVNEPVQKVGGQMVTIPEVLDMKAEGGREKMKDEDSLLRVYMKEDDQYHHVPLYEALLKMLQQQGLYWVTVARNLEGFGKEHVIHKAQLFHPAHHPSLSMEAVIPALKLKDIMTTIQPLLESASGPAILLQGRLLHK